MSTSACTWRKSSIDSDSAIENKRSKNVYYYFRLASESPTGTEDDTESIYSIQDKETDVVKDTSDTSDTETNSELGVEIEIEYDVGSLSGSDREDIIFGSSSDSEGMMMAATVVYNSSLETFITDAEDSDNSQDDFSTGLTDYWTCIQCKSQNDNPQFRFCDKCFQDRKTFFPPRPRRHKKRTTRKSHSPVKLDALKSCLNGLSQDSGISSSQEFPSLCLDQIVVPPQHLKTETEKEKPSTSVPDDSGSRKRQFSESSLSEDYELPPPKKKKVKKEENVKEETVKEDDVVVNKEPVKKEEERTEKSEVKEPLPECKETCIMCNAMPKNSIFLHGRIAHMCCCYRCAMRTWKTLKRCPICKRKVSNVVRVFTT